MRLGYFPAVYSSKICVVCFLFLFSVVSIGTTQDAHERDEQDKVERSADLNRSSAYQEGLRENKPRRVAIVGSTVHRNATDEAQIETILINGSKIEAIESDLKLPPGTKVIDGTGKHCYPGLIDAYVGHEFESTTDKGTGHWNANIQSQLSVANEFGDDTLKMESMRQAGFTAALVAPSKGIISGQSSIVLLSNFEKEHLLLSNNVAQHVRLTVSRGRSSGYPNSPMGAVALARQTIYDAQWYQQAWQVARANDSVEQPETNQSLAALKPALAGKQFTMIETSNELFVGRADRFAREFGLKLILLGSGNEYRRLDEVAQLNRPIVLPINFPKAPDVSSAEMASDVSLEDMMHWDHAPENPGRLAEKNVKFVLTTHGLEKKDEFLSNLRTAVKRGLPPKTALAAVTIETARLYGVDHLIGSLEKTKLANITITDGDLFSDKSKVVETWVDGARFEHKPEPLRKVAGKWQLKGNGLAGKFLVVKEKGESLSASINDGEEPEKKGTTSGEEGSDEKKTSGISVKPISLTGTRLTGAYRSDELGSKGISLFSLIVADNETATGQITLPNGKTIPVSANLIQEESKPKTGDKEWDELTADEKKSYMEVAHAHDNGSQNKTRSTLPASFAVNFPLGAYGRAASPTQVKNVLIKNVTLWSLDSRGKIENGSVLFGGGKILGVFEAADELPVADSVIDGNGAHLTPGIIDCHSHMATDSGVNESGQAITAEVRIGDMIDCDDINIYRQLGGGVTASNILHGSANPIGGQNQVIKLRWGASEEEMKFAAAPAGIKFALGENVKQSNWSDPTNRYPQTRMGVEQLIDDAFRAAKDYQTEHQIWNENRTGLPPRVDLELQALAEIVDGERWIHCHSYRQDEILALMRTLESHEITIGSFQHILEGYKVANEMAQHGAMASAFADWWAYKYEVKDAIPYAGALMHRAGVIVSFNSDDRELARHLNHEAAKAVKYGGVPEIEALKFVTLNPAKQLRIDDRVGSIEVGKDADFVLWSGHPLSNLSVAKQTWIDGRKYFDRDQDVRLQTENRNMRLALIQKILESGEEMEQKDKSNIDPAKLWPRFDEFCHGHEHGHGD